jgi:hypothetical protein
MKTGMGPVFNRLDPTVRDRVPMYCASQKFLRKNQPKSLISSTTGKQKTFATINM